jgi:hypothetical protein
MHIGLMEASPWMQIFASSGRKKWTVYQALHGGDWIKKVNLEQTFIMYHLTQFVELWVFNGNVQLGVLDEKILKA